MKIHLIGIGGIGMSGLARLYLSQGHTVQGSDLKSTSLLQRLESEGIRIFIGHDASHIEGSELVVYSTSILPDHPERLAASRKKIRILHRAEALAEFCRGKFTIAVTGTHGKTTTTALVGMILKEAGRDPSIVLGGLVKAFGGNAVLGQGREIVIEADESDSSFLKFDPDLAVITNMEAEHMEHFKTMARVEETYRLFLKRLKPNGRWIACSEDRRLHAIARGDEKTAIRYGFDKTRSAFWGSHITECPDGRRGVAFNAWHHEEKLGRVEMNLLGPHNVLNALGAIAVGRHLGIAFAVIAAALQKYEGASRRFDVRYEDEKFLIVDDYAHHPTEIRKTLAAAKALDKKRIVALFQPHRYSRTEELLEAFGTSFEDADKLFITDIYAASEQPREGITGSKLSDTIREKGHRNVAFVPRAALAEAARSEVKPGDLVIVLGAGDIYQVADSLAEQLKKTTLIPEPAPAVTGDENIFGSVRGKVLNYEPLSGHTSIKIGGPASYWIEPADAEDLKKCLQICRAARLKILVVGAGSNMLAPDSGWNGAALHLGAPYFRQIRLEGEKIVARGGVPNSLFIPFAVEHGFGGCEFLIGIPGSIGGSVAMNAGSHGQSIDAFLETVTIETFDGRTRVLKKEEIPFSYRFSGIKDAVVTEVSFALPKAVREETQKILDDYRNYRARTQDLQHPSAGCLFKNPPDAGCASGQFIERAGLKGLRIGGAQVSEKHANFIINRGGATSKDVKVLLETVRQKIKNEFDVTLETEVKILDEEPAGLLNRYWKDGGNGEKIAVLAGGPSCEREISIISGQAVFDALSQAGFSVVLSDTGDHFVDSLKEQNVTLAFIALHGAFGEDGAVQKILENAGIAYTGAGAEASEISFDKSKTQSRLKAQGIRVPEFVTLRNAAEIPFVRPMNFPVVVKPSCGGSSVGVHILFDDRHYKKACEDAFSHSKTILVEQYIQGRELTVGILDGLALPIVEIIPKRSFYDYEAKYKDTGTSYVVPAPLATNEAAAVRSLALKTYRALGCKIMARVDILLDREGVPYVIEMNTIPGLTGKSLLPKAAAAAGIDFTSLCVRILGLSLTRQKAQTANISWQN